MRLCTRLREVIGVETEHKSVESAFLPNEFKELAGCCCLAEDGDIDTSGGSDGEG